MKVIFCVFLVFLANWVSIAQCSVCARTTEQLGPEAAKGFNLGIIYLMLMPLVIIAVIGTVWYRSQKRKIKH